MKIVLQKVKCASVGVGGQTVGDIAHGFLLLVGISHDDTESDVDWITKKIITLRLFSETTDTFMEKNIQEVGGSVLVVSQFTLYGDCRKGTRPSFSDAARPEEAEVLYQLFVQKLRDAGLSVATGVFQAHMDVSLVNDGPITLVLDSKKNP
ncbi:MAG TPA: D-tyrosyl-tRNA(Tyr) deacylase [Candidatus Magasanikbacteria bacterium]|nr:MAG: D-tyrosyl-tRNA(Tyr) deacylase [Candidatus Magasanikbacteria bacterium RIFCSPLOWO2_02_FULL_47_16]OGH80125.1 MAG: D-tyrosyl-tRNA(Tyr) deacylase [Candidatus Magasanikbacteria bacterium RIFCSPHIGHO2_02_FULL_48_18]OGH82679.1 MAG: D-tyrosyl-tRNA(Tyr) deacylase [Candidatus Magasanikbacteria bacterium RIFCSPLOWO2_12_FULL_47_9b]HAZ28955.1 D-tyrosyl-tRNA(Tyr) deacylase [Candidatus Magasanikbacteria bacterium]